jgi:urease accessory protein
MTAIAQLLNQRALGHVRLRMEQHGVAALREAGCSKVRVPRGTSEAILINTSGGLAGGDDIRIEAEAGPGAVLTLTTQAAERVYKTLGPAADVSVTLKVGQDATLLWLPQETIFFEGSALSRRLDVDVAEGATFVAVEPMLFGRLEMGEHLSHVSVQDRWHVKQNGSLTHAEAFRMGPQWACAQAQLGQARATATLLMIAPDVERRLDPVRAVLDTSDGASCWNGKLVARLLARDGYTLRKRLIQVVNACIGGEHLPKCWTF